MRLHMVTFTGKKNRTRRGKERRRGDRESERERERERERRESERGTLRESL